MNEPAKPCFESSIFRELQKEMSAHLCMLQMPAQHDEIASLFGFSLKARDFVSFSCVCPAQWTCLLKKAFLPCVLCHKGRITQIKSLPFSGHLTFMFFWKNSLC